MSSDKGLIKRAESFLNAADALSNQSPPNSPPACADALLGTELSLKAVLAKAGIPYARIHKLEELTYQVQTSGAIGSADMAKVAAGVTAVTMSGSYNFARYPEKDPVFFESLSQSVLQNRVKGAKDVFDVCASYVGYP
jgi:HEPN domain-containing protein